LQNQRQKNLQLQKVLLQSLIDFNKKNHSNEWFFF
jgi:hypothetical protein